MSSFTITCAAGHPRRVVAVVIDFGGWVCDPPEADMENRRIPVYGYSFRCQCGAGVAVHKDDMHLVLTEAYQREGYTSLSIQALARARRWHHGIRRPAPTTPERSAA